MVLKITQKDLTRWVEKLKYFSRIDLNLLLYRNMWYSLALVSFLYRRRSKEAFIQGSTGPQKKFVENLR